MKTRFRETLHLPPDQADKKQIEEDERNSKIEEEAKEKERSGDTSRLPGHVESNTGAGKDVGKGDGAAEGNLHEGKRVEDLTEEQRAERAIALIRSAMSKGKKEVEKKIEQDGEGADPQAQARVNGEGQAKRKEGDSGQNQQKSQQNPH